MKKSTKGVIGIIVGAAIATASAIILGTNKKNEADANPECIEAECTEVVDSDESTAEVE